ncbi:MAG: YsnF/AvaK domain-containing protein, partial [Hymenobacteraceae bacterium]|nr:YsnF/AvaK domain-containing protein [Hymenobacteraceae bacterium]MDX5397547.1 YsnF/AvaK domain-containing protein [Hymenobacteraceae bacterium]MDX5513625.1 YsnF/AvaK domain-containing protein [Hymenobacteraceae bacterium]
MSEKQQNPDQPEKEQATDAAGTATNPTEVRVPVVEEQLHVDKKQVETGRLRISKSVTEQQQEVITVPLTYEQVEV